MAIYWDAAEHEYKHWCGNCQIRIYIQRHYGRILTWQDCPYTCEYATAMRCSTEGEMTLELNSPITEEQWDAITDVDFEHTDRVWFHTKNGKDVEFMKRKTGKWEIHNILDYAQRPTGRRIGRCPFCGYLTDEFRSKVDYYHKLTHFCPNCGAEMEGTDAFCSEGERKEDE